MLKISLEIRVNPWFLYRKIIARTQNESSSLIITTLLGLGPRYRHKAVKGFCM